MQALQHSSAEQGSDEWLQARNQGIGSTDSATILGLNPYKTPIELWEEKLGRKEPDGTNWFMQRGTALEPVIRQHYCDHFGRAVLNVDGTVRHKEHDFLLASLDGYTECGRLTEFKTATTRKGWGEAGTDEVPAMYLIQVQKAMLVTGLEVADIGVSIGGLEPLYFVVEADAEIQAKIKYADMHFWRLIQEEKEPEAITLEEKLFRTPIEDGSGVYATQGMARDVEFLLGIKENIKTLEAKKKDHEESIKHFLLDGGASILCDAQGKKLVSWNESKGRSSFDAKRLKEDNPELHAQYMKTGNPIREYRPSTSTTFTAHNHPTYTR